VTDGAVSANGTLVVGGKTTGQSAPALAFGGELLVSDFSMDDEEGAEEIASSAASASRR
ncbi:MAG: hypothetical protein HGA94_02925, partial [Candidatus Aminicenantes bacterium]|nr:hypothetical protein [Candidatus Aminicenantes bacterium]